MADVDNIATAIEAGRRIRALELSGNVQTFADGKPFLVHPNGTLLDMEPWLKAPVEIRASVALAEAASFVTYVNRFKDLGTVVFADLPGRKFEAVLDYHYEGHGPRWGRHRATFGCIPTPDWMTWETANNKAMSQEDFARFIENNLPNIAEPAGSDLLQIALTLEVKKSVDFRSSKILDNGQTQFRYEETIEGRASGTQQGAIVVPTNFVLGLEPFAGTGLKRVDARLRYRLKEAKLSFWFELVRAEDVLRKSFEEVTAFIRESVGDAPVLSGSAPSRIP